MILETWVCQCQQFTGGGALRQKNEGLSTRIPKPASNCESHVVHTGCMPQMRAGTHPAAAEFVLACLQVFRYSTDKVRSGVEAKAEQKQKNVAI